MPMGDFSRSSYPPPPQQYRSSAYTHQQPQSNNHFHNEDDVNSADGASNPNKEPTALTYCVAIGVALLLSITGIFLFKVLLRVDLPVFTIDSATVTGFNLSDSKSTLSAAWDFKFTVINTSKKVSIFYDEVTSYLVYKSNSIAGKTVDPFSQGKGNSTVIRVTFAANGSYLKDEVVADLRNETSVDGNLGFDVNFFARILFDSDNEMLRSRTREEYLLKVFCRNVMISIPASGSGNISGGAIRCKSDKSFFD